MKKRIMTATVLCLSLLLGAGCGSEEPELPRSLPSEEREEKMTELVAFCEEHREKLNEMSEYFVNAVEDVSDYEDDEKLPDIDELADAFTDEEGKEILKTLEPFYASGYGVECKRVFYLFYYDEHVNDTFMVIYLEADGEEVEEYIREKTSYAWDVQKIDKHLYVVEEIQQLI